MKRLVILGAGGHGKVVADIAIKTKNYDEILFLDDGKSGEVLGLPVAGKIKDFAIWQHDAEYFVAIGNSTVRESLIKQIVSSGKPVATLIHPNATIAESVKIGQGTVIMAGAVINPDTVIGEGVIINTSCSIDHDNVIGDYVHVSVGTHLAGGVSVGKHTMVGAGTTVINNISICENCMVGAGAAIVKDIEIEGTYIGVPAKRYR